MVKAENNLEGECNMVPTADIVEATTSKGNEEGEGFVAAKEVSEFRNYVDSKRQDVVSTHYKDMRKGQSVEYVKRMHEKYSFADGKFRKKMTIREAFEILDTYVDSSDPDLGLPNSVHNMQTAEGIRKDGHPEWFQLIGLLHDMGKIMFALGGLPEEGQMGTADASQWGLGGDTWVVGCAIPDVVVFSEFNSLSPDITDERYNTECGMYQPNCGLDNCLFAYGHDEYMYQMLVANNANIPKAGLDMVRYHSAYPWHTGGAYRHLMNDTTDLAALESVLLFNKYDLYSKDEEGLSAPVEEMWKYYDALIEKYLPEKLLMW
jgi:inositol oxygenase